MNRSPFALASLLTLSAALAWPQTGSPQPQPGSSAPKMPLAQPGVAAPKSNSPTTPPVLTTPGATPKAAESNTLVDDEPLVPAPASNGSASAPAQPKTEILDNSATNPELSTDGHDPILDPPPPPTGVTTLVGGTIRSVDQIRDKMTIAVFGGNRWKIAFDERTHIFLNGAETTQLAIKKGERVYVDTMLDNVKHEVFARNIHLGVMNPAADADGQIVDLDESHQKITLRDQINSVPVHFIIDANTRIIYGSKPVSSQQLQRGSLVHVKFSLDQSNRGLAREITIIAAPGSAFTYVGKITYLDMHRGVLALEDTLDQKTYEIHFDPARTESRNQIAVGSEARIVAVFEGSRYNAQSITLVKSAGAVDKEKQ